MKKRFLYVTILYFTHNTRNTEKTCIASSILWLVVVRVCGSFRKLDPPLPLALHWHYSVLTLNLHCIDNWLLDFTLYLANVYLYWPPSLNWPLKFINHTIHKKHNVQNLYNTLQSFRKLDPLSATAALSFNLSFKLTSLLGSGDPVSVAL